MDYSKKHKNITPKPLKICVIWAVPFILLTRKWDHEIFIITMENIKKALKLKQYIDPRPLVPKEYYNIINKFKRQFMDQLPLH